MRIKAEKQLGARRESRDEGEGSAGLKELDVWCQGPVGFGDVVAVCVYVCV